MGTSSNSQRVSAWRRSFFSRSCEAAAPILLNNFSTTCAGRDSGRNASAYLQRPQRWDRRVIRDFLCRLTDQLRFDFVTGYVLLHYSTRQRLFQRWFVESLATQTLVLFAPTMGNPSQRPASADRHDGRHRGRARRCRQLASPACGLLATAVRLLLVLGFATVDLCSSKRPSGGCRRWPCALMPPYRELIAPSGAIRTAALIDTENALSVPGA